MISKLIYYKDKCEVEINRNKIISSNKTPGNMLSLKKESDNTVMIQLISGASF